MNLISTEERIDVIEITAPIIIAENCRKMLERKKNKRNSPSIYAKRVHRTEHVLIMRDQVEADNASTF